MSTPEQNPRPQLNDARLYAFRGKGRLIAFVCEDASCHASVLLSAQDYEARRPERILCDAHAAATRADDA